MLCNLVVTDTHIKRFLGALRKAHKAVATFLERHYKFNTLVDDIQPFKRRSRLFKEPAIINIIHQVHRLLQEILEDDEGCICSVNRLDIAIIQFHRFCD